MERVVVVAEIYDGVCIVDVVVQSYPVDGGPPIGNPAGYGVGHAFVYGRHGAGDVCVRNA